MLNVLFPFLLFSKKNLFISISILFVFAFERDKMNVEIKISDEINDLGACSCWHMGLQLLVGNFLTIRNTPLESGGKELEIRNLRGQPLEL